MTETNSPSEYLLYNLNCLAKLYHCNNIDCLILKMENAVEEFKNKAPHRTDYIESTQNSIQEMREVKIWIELLYRDWERSMRHGLEARILADIRMNSGMQIEIEKRRIQSEVDKLVKTLEFNEKI